MRKIHFKINGSFIGERLDVAVAGHYPELTRSALKSRSIDIFVNGQIKKLSYKLKAGDCVTGDIPPVAECDLTPQDIPFEIVYSDDDIAVVNKPAGIAVHPSKGHESGTLVNGLLYRLKGKLSSVGGIERPGIVHRLDKDTWGILVVALTDEAHRKLSDDFKSRKITKTYHAVVKGHTLESGRIDFPIGRARNDRKKMAVYTNGEGKPAITEYEVIEYLEGYTYLKVNLLTGRTHQIRVHFSHINHPVAGDPIYSRKPGIYGLTGIALASKIIEFKHPINGQTMRFEIDLPDEIQNLLDKYKLKD